ncbi:MAG TPA: tripartite tricarboxylate transporter substrate-binding protein [Xanthobacteraceae bacterium]
MMRRRFLAGIGWTAAGVALGASKPAAAEFYQGKTLTFIVGFAPGGGVDATARTVARHLVRFIPGQPGVVVQNMEGAAGIVAASYLARRAAPDGLTLAVPGRSWFIEGLVNGSGNLFDPAKLTYVGSPGAVNSVLYVRSGTGIKTLAELRSSPRPLVFGALGSTTATATVPALLAADGWPVKVVLGYVSTARVLLALEQNEVDGFFTVEDSLGNRQDLIGHTVIPVLQTTGRHADLPLLQDVVPRRELPLLSLILAVDRLGVPVVGPPGMPADLVAVLRRAFVAMARDPQYQADALKVDLPVGAAIDGAALAARIEELAGAATPDVIAAYRRLVARK